MLINKVHIANCIELNAEQKAFFAKHTEAELVIMASKLHGARISASSSREKSFLKQLQTKYSATDARSLASEWDFCIESLGLYIDLKSPGFDHNTPIEHWVQKYLKQLPSGKQGIFVICELPNMPLTMHWPVKAIEAYGFRVLSLNTFTKEFL
jgi:hypothetical protein